MRYGNVRKTDAAMVAHAASGMAARICVGLPLACSSLDDAAAEAMFTSILRADSAINLIGDPAGVESWHSTLGRLAESETVHGLVTGRCARILLDAHAIDAAEAARLMNLAVSTASDPPRAASWVDGFLRGSGDVLYHDDALFGIVDAWLAGLSAEAFPNLLPMIRRTFSTFEAPLRRNLGERARRSSGTSLSTPTSASPATDIDVERAASVLPLVARLLGLGEGRKS
jgi:hypothetical protein